MKTVFIFGAGASRIAGAPLMKDFLDRAEDILNYHRRQIGSYETSFNNVFAALAELQAVHAKSFLDLNNIEVIFGAFEMAQILGRLGNLEQESITGLRSSIIDLIVKTLEDSVMFEVRNGNIITPSPYKDLLEIIRQLDNSLIAGLPSLEYAFITFNYDLALDYSLTSYAFTPNYCLTQKTSPGTPYLKLHGSINWGTCSGCGKIIPYNILDATRWDPFRLKELKHVRYDLGSQIRDINHCGIPIKGPPVIIPPTWNKTAPHDDLLNVWRTASRELASAENIFVIGYSMPETDLFFRYLYSLGSEGPVRIKRFCVIDPDPEVETRFRRIIGRGIENRFRFLNTDFKKAIPYLSNELHDISMTAAGRT